MRSLTTQTFLTNLGIALLAFLTSAILARWLGPTGRGQLAAIVLWPTLLIYLANLGLFDAIVYFASLPNSRVDRVVGSTLALVAVQSAVVVPCGYALMPLLLRNYEAADVRLGRLYLLIAPIALLTQYANSLLQGRLQIKTFNLVRLLIPVGYAVTAVALQASERLSVASMVYALIALNAVGFGLVMVKAVGILGWVTPRLDLSFTGDLLSYGVKTYVSGIAAQMNLQLDQTLIALWLSPAQLGLYTAAVSAANVTQMLPQAVKMVSLPIIARQETAELRSASLASLFRSYWTISIAAVLGLAVVLPVGLPLVYGRAFDGSVATAELLLLASVLLGAKTVLTAGAQALGLPWVGSKAELVALGVTLALLPVLLPSIGIIGAAIASCVAYGTSLVVIVTSLRRRVDLVPRQLFSPTLAAARTMIGSIRTR